jgi:hypothetical protein
MIAAALGLVMGLSLSISEAAAGPCDGRKPCEPAPPGLMRLMDRDSFTAQDVAPGIGKHRRRERRRIDAYSEPAYDDELVQNYGDDDRLIGPTEAVNQALAAVPDGKPLGVKLLKGPSPVYAVKLRVRGRVRRILVDARTAQVLGE